ncbi:MAG: toll/interleukin-1 receptor domain-containing protein [Burkholderiaceae bacterium]
MRGIFISYRREDAEGQAGRLFDDLSAHYGREAVFMDVAGIKKGLDFRRIIDEHVSSCGVLLVIIGKRWLDAVDSSGKRRLDEINDFVRLETAAALRRDIPVVPVLVQGAQMPRAEDLPDGLKELAFRNGTELTHARWESDVKLLIDDLRPYLDLPDVITPPPRAPDTPPPPPIAVVDNRKPRRGGWVMAAAAVLVAAAAAFSYFGSKDRIARDEAVRLAEERAKTAEQQRKQDAAAAAERAEEQRKRDRATAAKPPKTDSYRTAAAEQRVPVSILKIAGVWRDSTAPSNGSRIAQDGNNFQFTRWGVLSNGIQFQSSGGGTIAGQRVTNTFRTIYQTGATSAGGCAGTISPDATRMDVSCTDSLLGPFAVTLVR